MEIKTLEVKNISHYERGSEETPCYNATVYINGKKAIEVGRMMVMVACDTIINMMDLSMALFNKPMNGVSKNKFGKKFFYLSIRWI